MRLSLLSLLVVRRRGRWPVGAGAQAKVCAGHPKDPSVVCARDSAHIVDICDRDADGHRAYARVVTKSTYPAYRSPYYDANDSQAGCSNLHFPSQVVSVQTCVQTEGCGAAKATGVAPPQNTTPPPPRSHPRADPAAGACAAPRATTPDGSVQLGVGLDCAPRGKRMSVSLSVHKRPGRAKPRVRRVVFYYRNRGHGEAGRRAHGPQQALPPDAADPVSRPARTTSTPASTQARGQRRSCAGRPWCGRFTVCALGEQGPQPPERVGDLRLGHDERRQEAQRARAR